MLQLRSDNILLLFQSTVAQPLSHSSSNGKTSIEIKTDDYSPIQTLLRAEQPAIKLAEDEGLSLR